MPAKKSTRTRANRNPVKLPPDIDGLFKRAAARAKKVIAMYDTLNPDLGRNYLVTNLLHDLMHHCDRDPELGNVDEECVRALRTYEKLVKENLWILATPDFPDPAARKRRR